MILLLNKSFDDLTNISMERLKGIGITKTGPGGVARLLLNVINENISDFYKSLSVNHVQAFISTSSGEFLDSIGYMLNCKRNSGEEDDPYKVRISQQILSTAKANETSVRLAALSTYGVVDVVIKKYTLGTGSFSVFVLTKDAVPTTAVVDLVTSNIDEVVAYGTKFTVSGPTLVPIEIQTKLIFTSQCDGSTQDTIRTKVQEAIRNYINSRAIGEEIIINEITQRVMDVDDQILNYQLISLRVNNKRVMNVDQECRWDERFIESSKANAIVVT